MQNNFISVKELPVMERPYEKCEEFGVASLSDSELLAVIMRSGRPGERSTDLARRVLLSTDRDGRLSGLDRASLDELKSISGVGRVKAIQLKCAAELGRRIVSDRNRDCLNLFDAASVAAYYKPKLMHLDKENVFLLHADGKGSIFAEECLSIGTVNSSLVSPREIFISALMHKSVYVFLIHNHPSGDPTPSEVDFRITDRLYRAGKLLGIELMDHIVLGQDGYISFAELGFFESIK